MGRVKWSHLNVQLRQIDFDTRIAKSKVSRAYLGWHVTAMKPDIEMLLSLMMTTSIGHDDQYYCVSNCVSIPSLNQSRHVLMPNLQRPDAIAFLLVVIVLAVGSRSEEVGGAQAALCCSECTNWRRQ